jgi:mRNA-capping enzyme
MMNMLCCSLEAAVREFTRARPTGIYKEDYIKELIARYGDETDDLVVPSLPDWCIEDDGIDIDVDDDGQRVVGGLSENGDSQKQTARRKQVQVCLSIYTEILINYFIQ